MRQRALDEARQVVYHSYRARVFNPSRADHAECSGNIVTDLIRRGDYRAPFHRRRDVFPSYDHLNFSRTGITGHAFIQNGHQPGLFFERAKEFAHGFAAGELRFTQDVRGSVNVDFTRSLFFAYQAAFAEHHRIAQQAIIKRLLLAHQVDDFGANRQQTLAAKLSVQVASRLIQLVLTKVFVEPDDFILDDVRPRDEHHEDALVRQSQKLDVLQTVLSQRRPHNYADIFRQQRKDVRRFFHQTIRPGPRRINLADALNRPAITSRETRVVQNVIHVIAVSLIGGNAAGRGMRLLEQSCLFQFTHHITNRRGAPPGRVRKAIG